MIRCSEQAAFVLVPGVDVIHESFPLSCVSDCNRAGMVLQGHVSKCVVLPVTTSQGENWFFFEVVDNDVTSAKGGTFGQVLEILDNFNLGSYFFNLSRRLWMVMTV